MSQPGQLNGKHSESEKELPRMTLLEHLEELRKRIIRSVLAVGIVFCGTYAVHEKIFALIALPLTKYLPEGGKLVYLKLQEPFTLFIKVSLVAAIFLSAPYIIYQFWLFIAPALYRHERRYVLPFVLFSSFLFISGCTFAYFIAFPSACAFFIGLGHPYVPNIDINFFFDLAIFIIVGMGAVFQIPIVIAFLSIMGLVTPRFLLKKIRHAIVIIFIVAAVISPTTDAINLFIFAAPMIVLYFLSVGVSWIFARRRQKKLEEAL